MANAVEARARIRATFIFRYIPWVRMLCVCVARCN